MPRTGRRAALLSLLIAVPLGGGCQRGAPTTEARLGATPEQLAEAVAVVGGEPILPGDVKRQAEAAGTGARTALDALVEAKLLEQEAARRGLETDKVVREAVSREMARRFLAAGFEREITPEKSVTEADILRAYDKNAAQLNHPEVRVVLHILAPSPPADPPAKREVALRRMQQVAERAREAHDEAAFRALVTALTDDAVPLRGEEIATEIRGTTVRAFADAAFAIPAVHNSSGVVETNFGFHVIWLKQIMPAVHVPVEQVREKLQQGLWPEARKRSFGRYVDDLVDQHKIEVFPGRIDNEREGAAP